ncbi:hypothetical protein FRC09_018001 [Ceratobasidium sp. 395]|nr:hypothetical protein FRC09_018001 [Ceratobasidium sp. 395]
MPLTFAQQLDLEELQRARRSSNKASNEDAPVITPRRSERKRRPSAHQLESQAYAEEYEASSRACSRSPSPSGRKPNKSTPKSSRKPATKSAGKPKKDPFGTRGDRPGQIVQPIADAGTASHDSSPEPLAAAESDHSDIEVETQRQGFFHIRHISREQAIRLATKHTGKDASAYSTQTLKKLLEDILPLEEAADSCPMVAEEQAPPTQYELARRLVLGSGHQPSAAGAADGASPQGAGSRLEVAPSPDAREEWAVDGMEVDVPAVDEPPAENSDQEPEFGYEMIELGPGDSVSQQPPPASQSDSHLRSSTKPKTPPPPPHRTGFPRTPHPNKSIVLDDAGDQSDDTRTIDSDEESALAHKRQRLTQPPQSPPVRPSSHAPTRPSSHVAQRAPPSQLGIYRPSGSKVGSLPLRAARHLPAPRPRASGSSVGLSKLPPGSDLKTGLAWAIEFAKREARIRATTVQAAGSSRQPEADFDLLAQVLGELHALADAPPPTQSNVRGSRGLPQVTEDFAEREAQAAFALGKRLRRPRKQPSLADYPGLPGLAASHTIPELVATAFAQGAYEGYAVNDRWAIDIYRDVAATLTDEEFDDPPRPLRSLVRKFSLPTARTNSPPPKMIRRISVARGDAADRLRQLTIYHRGFIAAPESIDEIRHNKKLAKSLLPNWFHYRDPAKRQDAYEDPTLKQYLALVLFWRRDSLGVVFHDKFEPTIPAPSIAFALTLMQHDLEEWSTGHWIKADLDATTEAETYKTHLAGLLKYEQGASGRFHEFQEKASKYGLNYAGMSEHLNEPVQAVTRAEDIRPDSPATKARAKGKGRATH